MAVAAPAALKPSLFWDPPVKVPPLPSKPTAIARHNDTRCPASQTLRRHTVGLVAGSRSAALKGLGVSCRATVDAPAQLSAFELSAEQKSAYEEQGFLAIPDFASLEECHALKQRMDELVQAFDPSTISVFSTRNQTKLTNNYFLHSAGNISFFFEENAFDEQGALKHSKALSINKVGHALHDLDPVFRAFSRSPKFSSLARGLGYHTPVPVQSMYIFKQPRIGGEVVPHQDSAFLYTDPPSCMGMWLALEDATEENGCLWALPGSQKAPLFRRFVATPEGGVAFDSPDVPEFQLTDFIPLPVSAGTLVVLHGQLVHFSYENKSPQSRHAYTIHVVEGEGCTYAADNWLQRGAHDPPFEPLAAEANSH